MTKTVLLGDICIQITDGTHSTVKNTDDGSYFLLSAKNIKDKVFISNNERKIDKDTLENLRKRTKTAKDDILVTSVGTIGGMAIIEDVYPDYEFQRSVAILKPDQTKVVPKYLYYYLRNIKQKLVSMATGAVQKCLFIGQIKNIKIDLPDLETQKKIADILGSLDEKIELNRKMNETLEQMGQALFRHYFVTNLEAEKWRIGKILDLGEVITGKTPSKSNADFYNNDDIPFLKVPDMHFQNIILSTTDHLSKDGANSQKNKNISKWSTCVSCIATVGIVSLVGKTLQTNQQINSIIPKRDYYRFFNYFMMREKSSFIKSMASGGTATPNLNKGQFENIQINISPEEFIKKFDRIVAPIFKKVELNALETQIFTSLRDSLLPRLISGKIKL